LPLRASVLTLLICYSASWATEFNGDQSERTPVFASAGAWMLNWSTQSENSLPKLFELRLFDAESGEFIGTITELQATGSGRKLFEDGGDYQIEVIAQNLSWTLRITDVDSEQAARMKRRAEGESTLQDSTRQFARQVREDSFESWRPVDDVTLLLFAKDETRGFRVTFAQSCEGLRDAKVLMFVSAGFGSGGELYDAVLLDDGTHCTFDRVVPTVFD